MKRSYGFCYEILRQDERVILQTEVEELEWCPVTEKRFTDGRRITASSSKYKGWPIMIFL